jgi:CDP-6-deoxy-D-xylo-4-hexulose-3-dehydrase
MKWPLMNNNIVESDMDVLVEFLSQRPIPILTNGKKVRQFEEEWSKWLGVKYSVFVNSGSSANILTLLVLKEMFGEGEVITAPLGWVSDVAAIMHAGMKPVFVDIKLNNLAIDEEKLIEKITPKTKAILLTHILGYNGLSQRLLDICAEKNIYLIEDVCESHGATFKGQKLGSFGYISNFSFYYAHHMTSIEGGMICTNDETVYNLARSFRSHAMAREMDSPSIKAKVIEDNPELNKDFIFLAPAYNMRSTEINAVMALNQLKRLDDNNIKRKENLDVFLDNLDPLKYYTAFDREGNSNYAFTLLLNSNHAHIEQRNRVEETLAQHGIEFRRGMSGGGNQLAQPYMRKLYGNEYLNYPACNFVHHFGWYIGNYPELEHAKIKELCTILNNI